MVDKPTIEISEEELERYALKAEAAFMEAVSDEAQRRGISFSETLKLDIWKDRVELHDQYKFTIRPSGRDR